MCSSKPPKPKPAPLPPIEPPRLQLETTKRRRASSGQAVGDREALRRDLGVGVLPGASAGLRL